ncbi:hypothetical protein HispidOSU_013957, partial [Sigmodon hispidus]
MAVLPESSKNKFKCRVLDVQLIPPPSQNNRMLCVQQVRNCPMIQDSSVISLFMLSRVTLGKNATGQSREKNCVSKNHIPGNIVEGSGPYFELLEFIYLESPTSYLLFPFLVQSLLPCCGIVSTIWDKIPPLSLSSSLLKIPGTPPAKLSPEHR